MQMPGAHCSDTSYFLYIILYSLDDVTRGILDASQRTRGGLTVGMMVRGRQQVSLEGQLVSGFLLICP